MSESTLVLRAGLGGGQVIELELGADFDIVAFLAALTPDVIFSKPLHCFHHRIGTAVLPGPKLRWLHFPEGIACPWQSPFGARVCREVPPDRFLEEMVVRRQQSKVIIEQLGPGHEGTQYLSLYFDDGTVRHFRADTITGDTRTRHLMMNRLHTFPSFWAEHSRGGWIVYNLAHLSAWQAWPGAIETPEGAWPLAHPSTPGEGS